MSLSRNLLVSRAGVCRSIRCLFSTEAEGTDAKTGTPPPPKPAAPEPSKTTPQPTAGVCRSIRCLFSTEAEGTDAKIGTPPPPKPAAPEPSKTTPQPTVGTTYGSKMYYGHNDMSFYDIESDMADKRVGQPSSKQ